MPSPSFAQISKKKNLSGMDAGRAVLMATAESAQTGQAAPLPANVAEYISTVLPYATADDLTAYRRCVNLCGYLSQQRALADAHGMRLYSYLISQLKTIETSYVLESALRHFSPDGAAAAAAYSQKDCSFVGYGIEAFTSLYGDSLMLSQAAVQDRRNAGLSRQVVACYNESIRLIEEASSVDLGKLRIDTAPYDEKTRQVNEFADKLRAIILDSETPFRAEKIIALDSFFQPEVLISEIRIPETSIERARAELKELKIFDMTDVTLADILMGADANG